MFIMYVSSVGFGHYILMPKNCVKFVGCVATVVEAVCGLLLQLLAIVLVVYEIRYIALL